MRRKSERNKAKASPEKVEKEKPKRGRPSRKRKKSSTEEEEVESGASGSEDARQDQHQDGDQGEWRVKAAAGEPGHPHKLKICLSRPVERSSDTETRTRRRDAPTVSEPEPEPERRRSRHRSRRGSNREPDPEPEPEPVPVPEVIPEEEPQTVEVKPVSKVKAKAAATRETEPVQCNLPVEPEPSVEPESSVEPEPSIELKPPVELKLPAESVKPIVSTPADSKLTDSERSDLKPIVSEQADTVLPVESESPTAVLIPIESKPEVVHAVKCESAVDTSVPISPSEESADSKMKSIRSERKIVFTPIPKVIPKIKLDIPSAIKSDIQVSKLESSTATKPEVPLVIESKVAPSIESEITSTLEVKTDSKISIKSPTKAMNEADLKTIEEPKSDIKLSKNTDIKKVITLEKSDSSAQDKPESSDQISEQFVSSKSPITKQMSENSTDAAPSHQSEEETNKADFEVQPPAIETTISQTMKEESAPTVDPLTPKEIDENKLKLEAQKSKSKSEKDELKSVDVSNSMINEDYTDSIVLDDFKQIESETSKETEKISERKVKSSNHNEPIKGEDSKIKSSHSPTKTERRSTEEEQHTKVTHKDKFSDSSKDDLAEEFQKTRPSVENSSSNNSRKRKWGSRPKLIKTPSVNISTDSLKNLISNVEPVSAEEALSDIKPKDPTESKPKKIVLDDILKPNGKYGVSENSVDKDAVGSLSHRKISIVNDEITKLHSPPSPPKYKSSTVLYITNLVRPFTLPQLKNLLQRTGRIVENGFWIDKIKSKCYVQYETEDEAIETRHALHGVTWPVSNPKTLNVDFGSKEAMDEALATTEEDKSTVADSWSKDSINKDSKVITMEVDEKSFEKRTVVREWDRGKGDEMKWDQRKDEFLDRSNNRHRDGNELLERRKRRTKSRSPSPARKFKKKEEEAPSKLLDDLFKKTKATPCIYWLPLNAETILIKEEQRRKHMAEHERRMEELRKAAEEHRMARHTSHHTSSHRHR